MKCGKISSQCCHACTIYTYYHYEESNFIKWFHSVQKKIILKAPQSLLEQLEKDGYIAIRDKGYTQIAENSLTVVTLGVMSRKNAEEIIPNLNDLQLL